MGRSLGLFSILCLLVNDACHRFDYLLGFLDALVVRSVAQLIPSFLLGFLTTEWPHHGLTTPGAFQETLQTILMADTVLSRHPMVYALGQNFFRYAPSVSSRSPWSLPVPECSTCGAGSQVWIRRLHQTSVVYVCKCCNRQVTLPKPDGLVKSQQEFMWQMSWDTYLQWLEGIHRLQWVVGGQKEDSKSCATEFKTVAEYLDCRLPTLNRWCRTTLVNLGPNQLESSLENILHQMEINRVHWQELIRLSRQDDDAMDTS